MRGYAELKLASEYVTVHSSSPLPPPLLPPLFSPSEASVTPHTIDAARLHHPRAAVRGRTRGLRFGVRASMH